MRDEPIYCPVCGAEAVKYYRTFDGRVVGCSECLTSIDADDLRTELEESDLDAWIDNLVLEAREEAYLHEQRRQI